MKFPRFVSRWLIVLSIPSGAYGWGVTGHDIIAGIMKSRLSPQGLRYVITHVGDGLDMMDASSWADSDDAKSRYPGSSELHHSSTPYRDCSSFLVERDCPNGDCIVTGIARSALIIADPSVPEKIRQDHFKFFLHFMGDIHQPLHTGFVEDHGGNDIPLSFPAGMSLHEVWDSEILSRIIGGVSEKNVERVIADQAEKLRNDIPYRNAMRMSIKGLQTDSMDSLIELTSLIASETTTSLTCDRAYVDLSKKYIEANEVLSRNYLKVNGPIVVEQLTKAAVRAAEMIEELAELFYSRKRAMLVPRDLPRSQPTKGEPAAPLPESSNRFATLLFDFDPEEIHDSIWSPPDHSVVTNASAVVAVRRKKPRKPDEDIFEGVDLTRIVLIRYGVDQSDYAITYREFAKEFIQKKKGWSYGCMRFNYVTIAFENGEKILSLHAKVFGDNPSKQLIVRCIAYLKGLRLDDKTDISLFISPEQSVEESAIGELKNIRLEHVGDDPEYRAASETLERKYTERVRRLEQRSIAKGYPSVDQMLDMAYEKVISEIFRISIDGIIFAIHPRTLKAPSIVTRFNAYPLIKGVAYLVVDPYICDGPLTERILTSLLAKRERAKNGKGLIKARTAESFIHHVEIHRPKFLEELGWLSKSLLGKYDEISKQVCIITNTDHTTNYLVIHYIRQPHPISAFIEHTDLDNDI